MKELVRNCILNKVKAVIVTQEGSRTFATVGIITDFKDGYITIKTSDQLSVIRLADVIKIRINNHGRDER